MKKALEINLISVFMLIFSYNSYAQLYLDGDNSMKSKDVILNYYPSPENTASGNAYSASKERRMTLYYYDFLIKQVHSGGYIPSYQDFLNLPFYAPYRGEIFYLQPDKKPQVYQTGIQEAARQLSQITKEQNDFNTFKANLDRKDPTNNKSIKSSNSVKNTSNKKATKSSTSVKNPIVYPQKKKVTKSAYSTTKKRNTPSPKIVTKSPTPIVKKPQAYQKRKMK